ncbi:hypothetical protein KSP39_PZI001910 [Platanthera zijinensis]|uniref:Uncharacterized protein n=1 Tax=Platanthera zijinensis TaxID=2320716 RepID=A0AAP0BXT4_9ASPA
MGACFSRSKGRGPPPPGSAVTGADGRRGPPPEPEAPQEETVKEVLSETPKPKPPRPSKEEEIGIEKQGDNNGIALTGDGRDDRSEVTSEVCSVSESLSVSTAVTEITAEERQPSASPVKFQRKRSSSSSDILIRKEKITGSVAAVGCRSGRSSPSPAKRREGGGAGRSGSAREASIASKSRGSVVGNALCRDPGDRSGRRSLSPAVKRAAAGQCRSASATTRPTGRSSPRRVAAGGVVDGARFGGGGRWMAQDEAECGVGGGRRSAAGSGGKETLENPLVSLECFIFL